MAGSEAGVVHLFGLVVQFYLDSVHFNTLKERLVSFASAWCNGVILELEESRDKVECILVNVKSERKDSSLFMLTIT